MSERSGLQARPVASPELGTPAWHTHFRWSGPLALAGCVAPRTGVSLASPIIQGAVLLGCPECRELTTPPSFLVFVPSQPSSAQISQVPHGAIESLLL